MNQIFLNKGFLNQVFWWLVNLLSRMLETEERDAVLGDLVEFAEPGSRALRDVLGLVARRQASLWTEWQPWMTLAGLVPLSMLLAVSSSITANRSATYIWLYANNWHWSYLAMPGFWSVLGGVGATLFLWFLTLACAAWTSGFVLGSVSRRNVQLNGALLCFTLLFGELAGVPVYWQSLSSVYRHALGVPLRSGQDPVVSALAFYRLILPLLVLVFLVSLPALWGMREGRRASNLRPLFRRFLWTTAAIALVGLSIQAPGFLFFLRTVFVKPGNVPVPWDSWEIRVLQAAVYWPVAYMVAAAGSRRWRRRAVAS